MSEKQSRIYVHYYDEKNNYDVSSLLYHDKTAAESIRKLEQEIEQLKQYRLEIFNQAQKVALTKMKTVVKIYRQKYDAVQFFVSVYETPENEDLSNFHNHIIGKRIYNERFPGKERHNVLKLANELVKKHNGILIKNF